MLIAVLVLSAFSLGVQATFAGLFMWAISEDQKEKKEARKKASEKKDNDKL